ncbi:MAG TPA: OmpA family protein [Candidatus Sulfotelmatobacter sp.]|nr:OmpA family protein [Candidatus Sulfotelmatobacter sp.]
MMFVRRQAHFASLIFVSFLLAVLPVCAQSSADTGYLKIHVSPKQAYVFVDGKAIRDGSQTIKLSAGSHEVSVRNYGYISITQVVRIDPRDTTEVPVTLKRSGAEVSGPFGYIEFKGHPRAAVLLNGTTPDYFVGHVDEFDWNWIWHQRLLVKPGTYQVMVTRKGDTIWSGPVPVKAGERVIVDLNNNGAMKTKNWPQGNTLGPQPRFEASIASAEVPIAPVTAQLAAQSTQLGCGQSDQLKWRSADAVAVSITNLGEVSASGSRQVSPTRRTSYELVAKGPGGEATQTTTVNVNNQPTATLTLTQPEVRYHKIGDKVVQDDSTTLNWTTVDANHVTITSLGSEGMSGSHTINAQPKQTTTGPVNEMVDYTLSASNACGGTTTKTAALHVVGSIDAAPAVTLASVFYPTNYPTSKHSKVGLIATEKDALQSAANTFKNHEEYDNDHASLMVVGHADIRGSKKYNLKLSARRADLVKSYLVSQGISADKIQTSADGNLQELSQKEVSKLQAENSQKPEKWMTRRSQATWLAYNRRVDIMLEPTGKQSTEAYPNDAPNARVLWQRAEPSLRKVESATNKTTTTASLQAAH